MPNSHNELETSVSTDVNYDDGELQQIATSKDKDWKYSDFVILTTKDYSIRYTVYKLSEDAPWNSPQVKH